MLLCKQVFHHYLCTKLLKQQQQLSRSVNYRDFEKWAPGVNISYTKNKRKAQSVPGSQLLGRHETETSQAKIKSAQYGKEDGGQPVPNPCRTFLVSLFTARLHCYLEAWNRLASRQLVLTQSKT